MIQKDSVVYDDIAEEYIVEDILGNGAFGLVYQIRKKRDDTVWALKTFFNKNDVTLLSNESEMAYKVNHENVIQYMYAHDGNTYSNLPPYLIMEYANEGTLHNILIDAKTRRKFLSIDKITTYFLQLIDGMSAVNNVIIHRDIKPDNILLKDGVIKISDFGLSKVSGALTRTRTFKGIGALKYLAPEGWAFDKNTVQMDIYSMGIVFYEIATLQHPLTVNGDGDLAWKEAHLFSTPTPPQKINPNITTGISQVILKMMDKNVNQRFKNWGEIKTALLKESNSDIPKTPIVDNLIKIQMEKDRSLKEQELKKKSKAEQKKMYLKTNNYQFISSIYTPLKEMIDSFNEHYLRGRILITDLNETDYTRTILTVKLTLVNGNSILISFHSLFDEDFIRKVKSEWSDDHFEKVVRPMWEGRLILGWGLAKASNGRGFNILLVENNNEVYGEWLVLKNTNSWLASTKRYPEPFAFELNELEKEIPLVRATHIFNTEVIPFSEEVFHELIIFDTMQST